MPVSPWTAVTPHLSGRLSKKGTRTLPFRKERCSLSSSQSIDLAQVEYSCSADLLASQPAEGTVTATLTRSGENKHDPNPI
jgi:hypothetical protein